jgi:hypothetical protein
MSTNTRIPEGHPTGGAPVEGDGGGPITMQAPYLGDRPTTSNRAHAPLPASTKAVRSQPRASGSKLLCCWSCNRTTTEHRPDM